MCGQALRLTVVRQWTDLFRSERRYSERRSSEETHQQSTRLPGVICIQVEATWLIDMDFIVRWKAHWFCEGGCIWIKSRIETEGFRLDQGQLSNAVDDRQVRCGLRIVHEMKIHTIFSQVWSGLKRNSNGKGRRTHLLEGQNRVQFVMENNDGGASNL